jgi:hypothetical protein
MKVISSLFDEIQMNKWESQCVFFDQKQMEFQFKQQLATWLAGKEIQHGRFFLELDGLDIQAKALNSILICGGAEYNLNSKVNAAWLKNELNLNETYDALLNRIKGELEGFFAHFTPMIEGYSFEFDLSHYSPDLLLKMAEQIIVMDDSDKMPEPYDYRKILVEQWKVLRTKNKQSLLVYFHPENDLSIEQFNSFRAYLQQNEIMVLFITGHPKYLKQFQTGNSHIIKSIGERFDLELLKNELLLFEVAEDNEFLDAFCIELALASFEDELLSLDQNLKQFVKSDKY